MTVRLGSDTPPSGEAALADLRARIDRIDTEMVRLLALRFACVREVIVVKEREGLPARLDGRVDEVVARIGALAEQHDLPPELAAVLWREMIVWIIAYENRELARADDTRK